MKLNLERPLVFFDLETTGVNIGTDRIVEISCVKVRPDGSHTEYSQRINPEMPIPAAATAIHHITDEDVKDKPRFRDLADKLMAAFEGCDIAGFNSNKFDIPLLMAEFARVGMNFSLSGRRLIDVQTIYHKLEQRTLSAAYRFYCGKNLEDAHSALADTMATYEVLMAQLDHYDETDDFGNDMEKLARFSIQGGNMDLAGRLSRGQDGEAVFNFGKYKGQKVADVFRKEPSYYRWMMQGDFPKDTKDIITTIYIKTVKK
ncbi:MAG: ribonuclease H-like domain-containing protein [Muribaculaceae bacterium]|nr:ribonuclease H-like domain-containing protein [Muribaculaceae bacterium]